MSDGALSQDDINKMLRGEIDLNEVSKNSDIPKEDMDLLLNAMNVYEKKKAEESNSETRLLKFTDDQLNKIGVIFGYFAQMAMNNLPGVLNCPVNMRVDTVNQITVNEFSRCIPTPTTLGFINMEPLKGDVVIEIDSNSTFAVIDIVRFGRTGVIKSYQEITNNEVTIINNLFAYILEFTRLAWSGIINIQPKLLKLETDPQTIKIAPASEMTALVTLAVNIAGIDGMINFCIPYPVIEPVLGKM